MNDRYDVVIAGGGPSGATAAMLLAGSHLSVALIDRARFPRIKPCAGAISGRAAGIIAELHGEGALPRLARARSQGCRMFDGPSLLAEADGSEQLAFVDRGEFDLFLLDAARATGCGVFEQHKVVHVDGLCSEVKLGSGQVVRASAIIGETPKERQRGRESFLLAYGGGHDRFPVMPRRLRVSTGDFAYHVLNRAAGRMRISARSESKRLSPPLCGSGNYRSRQVDQYDGSWTLIGRTDSIDGRSESDYDYHDFEIAYDTYQPGFDWQEITADDHDETRSSSLTERSQSVTDGIRGRKTGTKNGTGPIK